MDRSDDFKDGFRSATKYAVTCLHLSAIAMNDPSARAALNVAADNIGREMKKIVRPSNETEKTS